MTSKKGSLWKTSWNRGRGTPAPPKSGNMSFFEDFTGPDPGDVAYYQTAVPSSLGLAVPFWFGIVGLGPATSKAVSAPPAIVDVTPFSSEESLAAVGTVSLLSVDPTMGAVAAPDPYVSPSIYLVRPIDGGLFSVRVILANQVSEYVASTVPFLAATGELTFEPGAGALHGFCGGDQDLTSAEIDAWFKTLKSTLKIPEIPGKTTHLYSAESVSGTTPATLPNLGSAGAAQDMTLIVASGSPSPANNMLSAYFNY